MMVPVRFPCLRAEHRSAEMAPKNEMAFYANSRRVDPALGFYEFEGAPLPDTVGHAVETIAFRFQYSATGETFVDENGNGVWDAGEPFTDANGDGVLDEDWRDIPGSQTTSHLVYRLAAAPKSTAFGTAPGDATPRLWLKIVDFTCEWGDGKSTPAGVFGEIWNGSSFWTPFHPADTYTDTNGNGRWDPGESLLSDHNGNGVFDPISPDGENGSVGRGDPAERARADAWGAQPMAYTYRHDLPGGFDVDTFLDRNYARCGGWSPVLRAFMGVNGLASNGALMPVMRWRFVEASTGNTFLVDCAVAEAWLASNENHAGGPASAGDVWYRPYAIWAGGHGQANPSFKLSPTSEGSDKLLSRWKLIRTPSGVPAYTDHVFVKHNGRYYDPSYEHAGGSSYASINELVDAGISYFLYDRKHVFRNIGGAISAFDVNAIPGDPDAELEVEIWLGPFGKDTGRYSIFPNIPAAGMPDREDEMQDTGIILP